GFSEVLIFRDQRRRHVDELDPRLEPHGLEHRMGQVEPAARAPRTHIEQAGYALVLKQPEDDIGTVLDIHEVTTLPAVGIVLPVAFEEPQRLAPSQRLEIPCDDAQHGPLVILVGTIHVEKLESHALRWKGGTLLCEKSDPPVYDVLAPSVGVERSQLCKPLAT